ncbi:MAG: ATP-binding protein [Gammaproteobacteria bacterium]|nr:ATP-binding protein [Gammaproteobacteria bacterium]
MNEKRILEIVLGEFHDKLKSMTTLVARNVSFPEVDNKIKVAVGMRRSGKTCLQYQTIMHLLEASIPLTRILYINFEDDRLLPLDVGKCGKLIDSFYELYPENHDEQCYLFLDEIQIIEGWETVIRRIFDSKKVQIYLTGSSSKLLSTEIASNLRGRSIATEVWPYSFNEYLRAKNISAESGIFTKKKQDTLTQLFNEYLICGGFPEVTSYDSDIRTKTLQEYIEVVIYRDIIERHAVKHPTLIKYMIIFMLHNVSRPFTINKFYNDLKGQGYHITKDSLYEYLNFIEEAYLAFTISLYDKSIRKVQTNPKKLFAVDTGLINCVTLNNQNDQGKLFENIIYLELRRLNCKIYYYLTEERYEIDFLIHTPLGKILLLQVCWDMSNTATKQREFRALEQAQAELGIEGRIITLEDYLRSGLDFIKEV